MRKLTPKNKRILQVISAAIVGGLFIFVVAKIWLFPQVTYYAGQVAAIEQDGFAMSASRGDTVRIIITEQTRIKKGLHKTTEPLTPGSRVIVIGSRTTNPLQVNAKLVRILK